VNPAQPSTDELLDLALNDFEGEALPQPYCDGDWHRQRHRGEACPDCLSSWWSTDGSGPSDPAMYWLQIIARRRHA
jgi:hypothetical protein